MSSRISVEFAPAAPAAQCKRSGSLGTAAPAAVYGSLSRTWILHVGLLTGVLFWIVMWHWETASSMASIWWNSETFAHGLVVYPITLWLIWRQRHALAGLDPEPCYWALIPLVGAGFGWLVATAGEVQAGQHFCLVAMLALAPWAVLGTRIARVIAFPLVFTLFAAPIGDFLMPTMMRHTSDFTVAALRVTGIPVYREGLQFVIPSGRWSVVEACSGLRYLIASMVLGCLFAYLSYRSLLRRAAFIAASIVTPIVANWLRAYMIVMIGHYSGMKLAVGVDHLIYGWIFFGIVMLALFWIGSFWREDRPPKEEAAPQRQATLVHRTPSGRVTVAALAVALLTAAWPLFADRLEDSSTVPEISLAVPAAQDWMLAPAPTVRFQPHYTGARARFAQSYVRGEQEVGVFVGYYAAQGEGTELINFHNSIVPSNDLEWHKLTEGSIEAIPGKLSAIQTELKAESRVLTVWNWYWVGGYWTSSLEEAKLLTALNRLVHRRDDAAIVVIYTSTDEKQPIRAAQRLGEFTRDALPGLGSMLEKARSPLIRPASAPGLPLPLGAVVQPKAGA